MATISNLGYIGLSVRDLDAWRGFATNILGLQVSEVRTESSLGLRMDEHQQRIVLEEGDEDDIAFAGWSFDTASDLNEFVKGLAASGTTVIDGGRELAVKRLVEKVFVSQDPNGVRLEFFFGPAYATPTQPFRSTSLKSSFVTGALGIGHYFGVAKDYAETVRFYTETLGLKISDYIRGPAETPQGQFDLDATFFHTVTGRHHSFATALAPFPKKLHHVMLEVRDMDDVGLSFDRCMAAKVPIMMDLGHHPNDRVFSFYAISPSGFAIEIGWGSILIDDANWEVKSYNQPSDWGHKPR